MLLDPTHVRHPSTLNTPRLKERKQHMAVAKLTIDVLCHSVFLPGLYQ